MGTKVWDAKKEAIMAKATAIDNGMNISFGIPVMIKAGVSTARMQSNINSFGIDISRSASKMARCFRSEEHTSELQSLIRNSYAVFCLQNNKYHTRIPSFYIKSTT